MNGVILFLWTLSCALILCQWFTLVSIRRYLFGVKNGLSRVQAYPLLILLGVINVAGVMLSIDERWFSLDAFHKKIGAVCFFSYLGFALVMALYFGIMRLAEALLMSLKKTFRWPLSVTRVGRLAVDERGCLVGYAPSQKMSDCGGKEQSHKPHGLKNPSALEQKHREGDGQPRPPGEMARTVLGRRALLRMAAAGGVVVGTAMLGEGIVEAYQKPITEAWDFEHPMLSGLKGPLTIVHATDFHFGMFLNVEDLELLVANLNRIEGDALVLTGDIYHSPLTPVEESAPILRKLKPRRIGNFAVLGNHEFYAGVRRALIALEDAHIKVLRNEWHTYVEGRTRIYIGGIDDPVKNWLTGTSFPKFAHLMKTAPVEPGLKLLLSHRPAVLPEASKAGIDLVLSGHIHGGQIILPSLSRRRGVSVARLISPFTHGWYHMGSTTMYLNRGVGLTFVPWRINCPPEIAVFRLGV